MNRPFPVVLPRGEPTPGRWHSGAGSSSVYTDQGERTIEIARTALAGLNFSIRPLGDIDAAEKKRREANANAKMMAAAPALADALEAVRREVFGCLDGAWLDKTQAVREQVVDALRAAGRLP